MSSRAGLTLRGARIGWGTGPRRRRGGGVPHATDPEPEDRAGRGVVAQRARGGGDQPDGGDEYLPVGPPRRFPHDHGEQLPDSDGDGQGGPRRRDVSLRERLPELLVVALPFRSIFRPLDIDLRDVPPSQWVLSYLLRGGRTAGPGYLQVAEAYLQFGAVGVLLLYVSWAGDSLACGGRCRPGRGMSRTVAFSLIVMSEMLIWVGNSSAIGGAGTRVGLVLRLRRSGLARADRASHSSESVGRAPLSGVRAVSRNAYNLVGRCACPPPRAG